MIKFSQYKYKRPDIEAFKRDFNNLIEKFEGAKSLEEKNSLIREINKLRSNLKTMRTLVSIRHSIDSDDEFYRGEKDFLDENSAIFEEIESDFYSALVNSDFREGLEKTWGSQIFLLAELQLKTFSQDIMEELVLENKLVTEYNKLLASAKLEFDGGERNLSQMAPYMQSQDRMIRKRANEVFSSFFAENEEDFDRIYDELVQVRDKMAKKLGFENFVEMGYARMSRSDYDHKMVKNYRDQVYRDLLPLVVELKERQRKRLGVPSLKYYDEPLEFLSGNALPKGGPDWIMERGKKMYEDLSPQTSEFINFMLDRELFDVESKKGKMNGGYCTIIDDYKSPFIFSNFNGTSDDIDVLTHEAGHALQMYKSLDFEMPEYHFPTLEACEIHSMSMEFITWPYMELFFEEDADKYRYSHLTSAINFIPYGVTVDEFQHFVYQNPGATKKERKDKWRELERKYLPFRDYEDNDILNRGGYWFRQGHIFSNPFYYIDYTLAQVSAFQFLIRSREDHEGAFEDYMKLCRAGGSKSFLQLLDLGNLKNPFLDGTIKDMIRPLKEWLDGIDDKNF